MCRAHTYFYINIYVCVFFAFHFFSLTLCVPSLHSILTPIITDAVCVFIVLFCFYLFPSFFCIYSVILQRFSTSLNAQSKQYDGLQLTILLRMLWICSCIATIILLLLFHFFIIVLSITCFFLLSLEYLEKNIKMCMRTQNFILFPLFIVLHFSIHFFTLRLFGSVFVCEDFLPCFFSLQKWYSFLFYTFLYLVCSHSFHIHARCTYYGTVICIRWKE